jgi:hypothetical protein
MAKNPKVVQQVKTDLKRILFSSGWFRQEQKRKAQTKKEVLKRGRRSGKTYTKAK